MTPTRKLLLGLALTTTLFTGGCTNNATLPTDDISQPLRFGGEEMGGAPYAFKDPAHPDKRIGFEVEIMEELGRRLNRQVEFVPNDWDTLLMALNRGEFDVAMSGIEVTPERQKEVDFSAPYYVSTQQLVVRAADGAVNSLEDLRGKTVGTLRETTSEQFLRSHYPDIEVRIYDDVLRPYDELQIGHVDGVFLDLAVAQYHTRDKDDLRFAGKPVAPGHYAMAIRKSDGALKDQINNALTAMRQDGTLQRILEKWRLWNEEQETTSTAATETNAE